MKTRKTLRRSASWRGAALPAMAASAALGGAVTAAFLTVGFAQSNLDADAFRQLDLFGEVFERVHEVYVEDPDDEALVEGAIAGMLQSLDPHSSYLNAEDFETMQEQTRGSFFGLGIQVQMETEEPGRGLVRVVSPIDGTPAFNAGLQPGDLVYEIDGETVFGMTLSEAIALMKGPKGTSVDLTVIREDVDEPIEYTITRDDIEVSPVSHRVERDNFGYVRLSTFTGKSEEKVLEAIEALNQEAPDLRGIVLDLRSNPGGLLDQAVAVADAFLEGGEIVSTRGRMAKESVRSLGKPGDVLDGKPIVVLINGGSASASEIVAGALQDRNRALLVGTKSFGKGSVQTVLPLRGGAEGALRLTTARYYTPAGRSIQAQGIVPDIVLPVTRPGQDEPVERRSEADLRGALDVPASPETEEEETLSTSEQILAEGAEELERKELEEEASTALLVEPIECEAEKDCQLERALDILENQTRYSQLLADAGLIDRR
jgi:carboxyl-terminal processing protease